MRLVLSSRTEQTAINVSGIEYLTIARGKDAGAGPDLGAVLLSSEVASAVGAKKTFYNLDTRRKRLLETPPNDREGFWVASGFVAELTKVDPMPDPYAVVKALCHFGAVGGAEKYIVREPHDYFEFPISSPESGAPHAYGGISGSGLWHVPLELKPDGSLAIREEILQGITYYQDAYTDGRSALHCHGTRSIYEAAYAAVAA